MQHRQGWQPEPQVQPQPQPQPQLSPNPITELPLPGRQGYDATAFSDAGVDDEPPPSTPQHSLSPQGVLEGSWDARSLDAAAASGQGASPQRSISPLVAEVPDGPLLREVLTGVEGSEHLEGGVPPLRSSGAVDEDMVKVLGHALTACVYHTSWHVRECAVLKASLELRNGEESDLLGHLWSQPSAVMAGVMRMIEVALRDVNAKVFFAGTQLLHAALRVAGRVVGGGRERGAERGSPRSAFSAEFANVCTLLAAKLRDRNKRCVSSAQNALLAIASEMESTAGAQLVSAALMRVRATGLASNELERRLAIATQLIAMLDHSARERAFGVRQCAQFMRATSALQHSRQEVRDAARRLLVELALRCPGGVAEVSRELRRIFSGPGQVGVPDLEDLERAIEREWAASTAPERRPTVVVAKKAVESQGQGAAPARAEARAQARARVQQQPEPQAREQYRPSVRRALVPDTAVSASSSSEVGGEAEDLSQMVPPTRAELLMRSSGIDAELERANFARRAAKGRAVAEEEEEDGDRTPRFPEGYASQQ